MIPILDGVAKRIRELSLKVGSLYPGVSVDENEAFFDKFAADVFAIANCLGQVAYALEDMTPQDVIMSTRSMVRSYLEPGFPEEDNEYLHDLLHDVAGDLETDMRLMVDTLNAAIQERREQVEFSDRVRQERERLQVEGEQCTQ